MWKIERKSNHDYVIVNNLQSHSLILSYSILFDVARLRSASCREGAMCFCMHQHAGKHAVRRLDLPMKESIPLFSPVTAATLPEGAANAAAAAATVDDMVADLWHGSLRVAWSVNFGELRRSRRSKKSGRAGSQQEDRTTARPLILHRGRTKPPYCLSRVVSRSLP